MGHFFSSSANARKSTRYIYALRRELAMASSAPVHPFVLKRVQKLIEDKGITGVSLKLSHGAANGDNYSGIIEKVTITGTDSTGANVTFNWVIKCAPQAEVLRKYLQVDRLFRREIYVYEKLFPLFKEFRDGMEIMESFACTPTVHMSCIETFQETLVMDDMKSLGFVQRNQGNVLDYNHVRWAMRAYGKLHALSFALRDQRPEDFKKIIEVTREKNNTNMNITNISHQQRNCCNKAADFLKQSKDRLIIDKFKKFADKSMELRMEAIKLGAMGPYAVISHGDSSAKNMLFKYEDEDNPDMPTDICLLDWQFSRCGSPALDLSRFLFTSTDKKFRDQYYDQMIRTYYYSLCRYLVELGSDPEKLLPFNILELQLKRFSVYGLSVAINTLHIIMSDGDVPDWTGNVTEENIDETFGNKLKNNDAYRIRIRDIIGDFIKYGYLDFLN